VCRSKHVEQLRNIGIINSTTRSHLVGYFYSIYIMMHGSINIKEMCSVTSRLTLNVYLLSGLIPTLFWTVNVDMLLLKSINFLKPKKKKTKTNKGYSLYSKFKSIYLSGLVTAVAVFRNPNNIPFCLTTDLLLNVLFSWLPVHLPSTFFLDVLFFFFPLVSTP